MMRPTLSITMATFLSVASATMVMAQTPKQDQTYPTQTQEAPTTGQQSTSPSTASSPHQREATDGKMASKDHDKMMNDCVQAKQKADSSMTASQAKKACKDQMKSHSDTMTR